MSGHAVKKSPSLINEATQRLSRLPAPPPAPRRGISRGETGESLTELKREQSEVKPPPRPIQYQRAQQEVIVIDDSSDSEAPVPPPSPPVLKVSRKRPLPAVEPVLARKKPRTESEPRDCIDLMAESQCSSSEEVNSNDSIHDFVVSDDNQEALRPHRTSYTQIWATPNLSQEQLLLDEGLCEVEEETPAARLEKALFGNK